MSIIPKISVGVNGKRYRHNLSFDSQTTCNFGEVVPVLCREMIPQSKFSIKSSSVVRLSSMPKPTFGRVSMRQYNTFNKYQDLWRPFPFFLANKPYTNSDGQSWTPSEVPTFMICDLYPIIQSCSDYAVWVQDALGTAEYSSYTDPYLWSIPHTSSLRTSYVKLFENLPKEDRFYLARYSSASTQPPAFLSLLYRTLTTNNAQFHVEAIDPALVPYRGRFFYNDVFTQDGSVTRSVPCDFAALSVDELVDERRNVTSESVPSLENADLILQCHTTFTEGSSTYNRKLFLCIKFTPFLKHLRKILIGLGYQFNVNDYGTKMSLFKVWAFYKSWFDLLRPTRELQFCDTNCFRMMRLAENSNPFYNGLDLKFFIDLAKDTYYYFPSDYFSMGLSQLGDNTISSETAYSVSTPYYGAVLPGSSSLTGSVQSSSSAPSIIYATSQGSTMPLMQHLADRLLRFVNKNNVIGRAITDYCRVHFGIQHLDTDNDGVNLIGSSRLNISLGDIMAQSETSEAYLGEFAGYGIGRGNSETFDYKTDNFGVVMTLLTVVPEAGYYQGVLKENTLRTRFDFATPAFDAMGYEVVAQRELESEQVYINNDNPSSDVDSNGVYPSIEWYDRGFSFVPRYSHYKVGRNIVNGDLSLPSLRNSMRSYYLDRVFGELRPIHYPSSGLNGGVYTNATSDIFTRDFIPRYVFDGFRKLDNEDFGDYSRIFNYTENDYDHVIVQQVFEFHVSNELKSLSTSFDTFDGETDDTSINVKHS